jgi:hypothetical protein
MKMKAPRSQSYREAAADCIKAGERCSSSSSAAFFQDLARRWHDLAQEQEAFERRTAGLTEMAAASHASQHGLP